jgi:hypothetical protein
MFILKNSETGKTIYNIRFTGNFRFIEKTIEQMRKIKKPPIWFDSGEYRQKFSIWLLSELYQSQYDGNAVWLYDSDRILELRKFFRKLYAVNPKTKRKLFHGRTTGAIFDAQLVGLYDNFLDIGSIRPILTKISDNQIENSHLIFLKEPFQNRNLIKVLGVSNVMTVLNENYFLAVVGDENLALAKLMLQDSIFMVLEYEKVFGKITSL